MRVFLFVLVCFFHTHIFNAQIVSAQNEQKKDQQPTIDSLLRILKGAKTDTLKAHLYYKISREYESINPDSALFFCNKSIQYLHLQGSINITDSKGAKKWLMRANSLQYAGLLNRKYKGLSDTAIALFTESLKIFEAFSKSNNQQFLLNALNGSANCYNSMANALQLMGKFPEALKSYHKAIKIFEELPVRCNIPESVMNSKSGICSGYANIGNVHLALGNFDAAKEYFEKSLIITEASNDKNGLSIDYQNMGNVFYYQGKYTEALLYYQKALKVDEEIHDLKGMSIGYLNIGNIYGVLGNFTKSIFAFRAALKIAEELNDKNNLVLIYNNIAELYYLQKDYRQSIAFSYKGLKIAKEIKALPDENTSYLHLKNAYIQLNDYKKALAYYDLYNSTNDSLFNEKKNKQLAEMETKYQSVTKEKEIQLQKAEITKKNALMEKQKTKQYASLIALILFIVIALILFINYKQKRKANTLLTIRNVEIEQQKEEILTQTEQLQEINKELEKLSIVARETDNAIVIFDAQGKPEWVNEGFTRLNGYTLDEFITEKGDNLFKMSSVRKFSSLVNDVVFEKKVVSYSCMITSKDNKKLWIQTTLSPVVDIYGNVTKIIAIDSDISKLIEAEEEIKQQKEEIEAQRDEIELHLNQLSLINEELSYKNKQIIDSITYAKLIQEALLPDIHKIRQYFPDLFIYFKPRDIVSGDFYWFHNENNLLFFAVADCTGHGVPGAFMSMIGTTMLNEIVKNQKVHSPSQILTKLNQEILSALKQHGENSQSQGDGMDITFVVYDLKLKKLTVSMANHTMVLIQQKNIQLIKGDIFSIGGVFGSMKQTLFTNHEFLLADDDARIYLFTDGIKDQFNIDNEKFGEERLQNILLAFGELPMEEQQKSLQQTFGLWLRGVSQIDDVLVAGIKLC